MHRDLIKISKLLDKFFILRSKESSEVGVIGSHYLRRNINNCEIIINKQIKSYLYCTVCNSDMNHDFYLKYNSINKNYLNDILSKYKCNYDGDDNIELFKEYVLNNLISDLDTIFIMARCCHCENYSNVLIYKENSKPSISVIHEKYDISSSNDIPYNITYYINEALKCKNVNAYSASVAMYRTALDNLLYDNGYTQNKLASKISQLEEDKASGKDDSWLYFINEESLDTLRQLGNYSVHPNNGNINIQEAFYDEKFIHSINKMFKIILDCIYIKPKELENISNSIMDKKSEVDFINSNNPT